MSLWPIALLEDRYGGVYSGGAWVAMGRSDRQKSRDAVFEGTNASDNECAEFWTNERKALVGLGPSPNEALQDLMTKFKTLGEATWWSRWNVLDEWD